MDQCDGSMGWDNDKSGDDVPPPVPAWIWIVITLVVAGIFALAIFGS